jgi:hypothetical protein
LTHCLHHHHRHRIYSSLLSSFSLSLVLLPLCLYSSKALKKHLLLVLTIITVRFRQLATLDTTAADCCNITNHCNHYTITINCSLSYTNNLDQFKYRNFANKYSEYKSDYNYCNLIVGSYYLSIIISCCNRNEALNTDLLYTSYHSYSVIDMSYPLSIINDLDTATPTTITNKDLYSISLIIWAMALVFILLFCYLHHLLQRILV